jgi:hypothetical protein
MSFVAVAIGGGALVSGVVGAYSANKAADTQAAAAGNALAFQKSQYDTSQANFKPYMDAGAGATYSMSKLLGTGPGGQQGTPDYSGFYNSPDYAFAKQQGELGIEQGANARGMNLSGNTLRDLSSFNSGLATQQYGNYYNKLMGLSQLGQASAAGSATSGTAAAGNIGNTTQAVGQAQASGIVGSSNAITGAIGSGTQNSLLANYLGKSPSAYSTGNVTGSSNAVGAGTDAQYNNWAQQNGIT